MEPEDVLRRSQEPPLVLVLGQINSVHAVSTKVHFLVLKKQKET
jgi:hypothetical protein